MDKARIYGMLWIMILACWLPQLAAAQQMPAGDDMAARLVALEGQAAALRSQIDTQQKALTALQTALEDARKRIHFLEVTLLSPAPKAAAKTPRGGGGAHQRQR